MQKEVREAFQQNAIKFIDYVIEKFPFRIHTIRTGRGHEFQAQFHWHVEDKAIRHVYKNLDLHSSTERPNDPTERIKKNFINC